MLVAIDPGHGGNDRGAQYGGINECDVNLSISFCLGYELRLKGHEVIFTRTLDIPVLLETRVKGMIEHDPDLFISIHCDAFTDLTVEGMTIYTRKNCSGDELIYANKISNSFRTSFPTHKHRGIKEANFQVLMSNPFPAILVECEFLSNNVQREFLRRPENHILLANSLVKGITGA